MIKTGKRMTRVIVFADHGHFFINERGINLQDYNFINSTNQNELPM